MNKPGWKELIVFGLGLYGRLLVPVLAGSLLAMHYRHNWTDPNPWILYSELACLFIFGIAGLAWAVCYFIRRVRR